jgi:hypothetical protein
MSFLYLLLDTGKETATSFNEAIAVKAGIVISEQLSK